MNLSSSLITHLLAAVILSCAEPVSARSWLRSSFGMSPATRSGPSCQEGDGSSYRGSVSVSARGRTCLNWDQMFYINNKARSHGLGYHNHCRNHNRRNRPWCLVKGVRNNKTTPQFCDIPKCRNDSPTTTLAPQTIKPPTLDTERTCGEKTERRSKIVGGLVTAIESQPWTAAIFVQLKRISVSEKFLCGGSLISPCWVLTAAHCFDEIDRGTMIQAQNLTVYLGKSATNQTNSLREQTFSVEQLITHQDFNSDNYNNDIALLKLRSNKGVCAVQTDSVRTVCLPPPHTRLPHGSFCNIVGYGKERNGAWEFSKFLRQASVQTLSQKRCHRLSNYGALLTDNMFCAASPNWSADACQGDSGGPLVCDVKGRVFLFGVVSWGDGCAQENKPGVYTRISNFNSWISETTGLPAYTAGVMYPVK